LFSYYTLLYELLRHKATTFSLKWQLSALFFAREKIPRWVFWTFFALACYRRWCRSRCGSKTLPCPI